jgi:hypothetical protein
MKRNIVLATLAGLALVCSSFLQSCASSSKTEGIEKPQLLFRSPNLDFTKVAAVGIMPVNSHEVEIPEITGMLSEELASDLKRAQSAWKVISSDEILRRVNELGLGRGYQNYVADLNTFVGAGGATPLFSAETQKFFEQLKKEMNVQALLFTSYGYSETTEIREFLGIKTPTTVKVLRVHTTLYDLSSLRTWWMAMIVTRGEENTKLVRDASLSFAQNFGKGTLRQL